MPKPFPVTLIKPLPGRVWGTEGNVSMEIPLTPFNLGELNVETLVRLDGINLPSMSPQQLAGQRFTFPSNPAPGHIDGSIYIEHAHHPFDVDAIAFVSSPDGALTARILGVLVLEVEGLQCDDDNNEKFANARIELETRVSFEKHV